MRARRKALTSGERERAAQVVCAKLRGPMNILEPAEADIVKPADVEVWVIPGLAFTKDGKRLGYGDGWYDRLLAVLHHTLWSLFGIHRLTITGKECRYEKRLGPRIKRRHFELSDNPQVSSYPGGLLQVATDVCNGL